MTNPDTSHRIHLAANDPEFPAKREAAYALIVAAIARVVEPLGYTLRGSTWSRETAAGKTAVNLQRSRYGFDVCLVLRFLGPDGMVPDAGIWAQEDDASLAHFYHPDEAAQTTPGVIAYLDVIENPASLDLPMAILADRALPWLDAHHQGMPALAAFIPPR
jgi:hypothetical protein